MSPRPWIESSIVVVKRPMDAALVVTADKVARGVIWSPWIDEDQSPSGQSDNRTISRSSRWRIGHRIIRRHVHRPPCRSHRSAPTPALFKGGNFHSPLRRRASKYLSGGSLL